MNKLKEIYMVSSERWASTNFTDTEALLGVYFSSAVFWSAANAEEMIRQDWTATKNFLSIADYFSDENSGG